VENKRKTYFNLVIGINGTGKSSFLRNEILKSSAKAIVVHLNTGNTWNYLPRVKNIRTHTGHGQLIFDEKILDDIKNNFFGGTIIFDDYRNYFMKGTPTRRVQKFWNYCEISHRHYGIDIYLVAHGLRQIQVDAFSFVTWLFLFDSTENFYSRKNDLLPEDFEKIIQAQKDIKKEVLSGNPYARRVLLLDTQFQGMITAMQKNEQKNE
jgi:hypothetical protein